MPRGKRMRTRRVGTPSSVFYGSEFIFPGKVTDIQVSKALNWYNYTQEPEKGKTWLVEYVTRQFTDKKFIQAIKRAPINACPATVYWLAKMLLNGSKLPKDMMKRFNDRLKEVAETGKYAKDPEEVKAKKKKPNVQDRIREKGWQTIADLEEILDGVWARKEKFSMYEWLQKEEISSQGVNMIVEYYQPKLAELNERDADVAEAYGKDRPKLKKIYEEWFADLDRYNSNRKGSKVRKPRKRKEKLAVDVIKRLKYQKEFKPLKIVSVNPVEMVGCQQLWVYNTKYKQLAVYYAAGPAGISVKGTTLIGFDKAESEYKTLKKPNEQVAKVLTVGKVALRKFMGELTTKARKPNGRINANVVLLRVLK